MIIRIRDTMDKVPMTVAGYAALEEELKRRQQIDRPRIIQAIAEARSHGDLSENAEYHAAREQQGFIEGRIAEIEGKLFNAQIIDVSTINANGKIVFGATVELLNMKTGQSVCYQIVGEDEGDIKLNLISIRS